MVKIKKSTYEYILLLIAFLYSGYVLAASENRIYAYSIYFIGLITMAVWLIKRSRHTLIGKEQSTTFFLFMLWIFSLVFNYLIHSSTESWKGYISTILIAVIAFIFVTKIKAEDFGLYFIKLIFVISVVSLFCFYILQFTSLFDTLPILRGTDQFGNIVNKYQGFLIYYRLDPLRNSGPFWEPGIFASYLIIALLFVNRYINNKKQRWLYYAVFIVAIISTASSAGYMLLAFVLICIASYKIAETKNNTHRIFYTVICLLFIVCALIMYFNLEKILTQLGLRDQLLFSKLLNISDNARATSITWNWDMFISNPIFGHGFSGLAAQNAQGVANSTTTSMRLMAALGIVGALYTFIIIRGVFHQKNISLLTKIVFLLIWMMIVNKEGHDSFVISWMLMFYFNMYPTMLSKGNDKENSIPMRGDIR